MRATQLAAAVLASALAVGACGILTHRTAATGAPVAAAAADVTSPRDPATGLPSGKRQH
jgi:hypothetical protein